MRRLSLSFVVGVVVVVNICCVGSSATMTYSSRIYATIEEHLDKFVKNKNDCDSVMAEAKNWLARLKNAESSKSFQSQIAASNQRYEAFIDCLEKFTALGSIVDNKRCDQDSYTIRTINEQIHRWRALHLETYENTVRKFSYKHAAICKTVFPERYQAKVDSLDKTLHHRLEVVLNDVVFVKALQYPARKWKVGHMSKVDMLAVLDNEVKRGKLLGELVIKSNDPFEFTEYVNILCQAIEVLAKEDEDQDFVSQTMKKVGDHFVIVVGQAKRVLERYLLDPCSHFYAQLGPNIFSPAYQDTLKLGRIGALLSGENSSDYYFSWAKYRVCEEMLQSKDLRLHYLVRSIETQLENNV